MAEVKAPEPVPSVVFVESAIVGVVEVLQQTPRAVTADPPISVTLPPPVAVVPALAEISAVLTVGGLATVTVTGVRVVEEQPEELGTVHEITTCPLPDCDPDTLVWLVPPLYEPPPPPTP